MTEETRMILAKLESMDAKIESMDAKFESMNSKIRDIQLTLENETNRNIQLVAEGHLDLNRKLNEALKIESEKEMLLLRVNILESELKKVKEIISQIA